MEISHIDQRKFVRIMNQMTKSAVLIFIFFLMSSSLVFGQQLNRKMKMDDLEETNKINPEPDKAYVHISSQIQNLRFDSNRKIDKVNQLSSGDWELWLPAGTHILKFDAEGFQRLEIAPFSFAKKRSYEIKISAVIYSLTGRSDENLFEISFLANHDSIYSSYGDLTPALSKSKTIIYKLPKGDYTFRFQKQGFEDDIRTIHVTSQAQETLLLKPGGSSVQKRMKLPGVIVIISDPSGAEIMLNGQKIGNTPFQGEVNAGNYQLELRKPLYQPNISTFSIEEGKTQTLNLKFERRSGYLTITSSQPNSKVALDGKPLGLAPINKIEIESITHALRIEAELYHPYVEEFKLNDGEEKIINASLDPAFGTLQVTTDPDSGAEVFLDGRKVGKTPFRESKIPSGKYLLKVTRPMFNDIEEEITIADGQATHRAVALSANFGELNISAEGSTISINGQQMGREKTSNRLAPGTYKVTADRGEKYIPAEQQVFLAVNEKKEITLTPEPKVGSVTILVEPNEARDADIFINNKMRGKAPQVMPLAIGEYRVMAKKLNFLDVMKSISIKENEQSRLTLSMIAIDGSVLQKNNFLSTTAWISGAASVLAGGAAIYFNSQKNNAYNNYKIAATTADADKNRDLVTKNNTYYKVSVSIVGVAVVAAIVSLIVQAQ